MKMPDPAETPAALAPNIAWTLWWAAACDETRAAILEGGESTSYGELCELAAGFTRAVDSAGIEPGDRVAVWLERGARSAAAFFGIAAAGGVAVMVNETLRPRQIEYILTHSGASAFVTTSELLARQPRSIETSARVIDAARVKPAAVTREPAGRIGADVAMIVYTSGSTGRPKGVAVSHGNLWAGMTAVIEYLKIDRGDRIASLLPFSFDYGFNQLLCSVGARASLVVERSPLAHRIVTTVRALEVTVLPAVPPLWLQLVATPAFRDERLPSLRAMTNTGGRVPTEAVRAIRRSQPHAELYLMYGLTEAFRSTYLPPDEVDRRPDSIGRAIPGAEILVVGEDLTPCVPGEVGELVHRGPTVTLGYWNDPEATDRVFRPHPFVAPGTPPVERVVFSGDLVRRDEDGFLYHVGRRDGIIKTLGFRVSPDEIAEVLYASGQIVEAVITSEPDAARGACIVAHVVLADAGSADRLEAYCRQELPRYMQPARIEVRSELPRTASGKHDLRAIGSEA